MHTKQHGTTTFHHNGDYSGEVRINPRSDRWPGWIEIPFADLLAFVEEAKAFLAPAPDVSDETEVREALGRAYDGSTGSAREQTLDAIMALYRMFEAPAGAPTPPALPAFDFNAAMREYGDKMGAAMATTPMKVETSSSGGLRIVFTNGRSCDIPREQALKILGVDESALS